MADPARRMDEPRANPPISPDPFNPMPPLTPEAAIAEERYANANERPADPVVNRVDVQAERRTGTSVLIAAVVLILALIAYLIFASGDPETAVPPQGTAVTEPAGEATPAPTAVAPAEPATEPNAAAPAETAPEATAPAETAPATPAPAPAPAQ